MDGAITEFVLPNPESGPLFIAAGSDGAMWFTENSNKSIGRITMDGTITEFVLPDTKATPWGIGLGPDGNMWFTENTGNRIGRITTKGKITQYDLPTPNSQPSYITAGPDGAMWFTETETNKISRITMKGDIRSFTVPQAGADPSGIAAGADGKMWFTTNISSQIGSISTGAKPTLTSSITGTATPNSTVTCSAKLQTYWTTSKLRYAWFKDGVQIPKQSKKGYVVSSRDKGAKLSCRVSVTLEPVYKQLGAVSSSVKIR
jgi:virginiamycin B lyase